MPTKLSILLLTQIVPYPPDAGPKVKTYHVLRYLAERGHRVTLASFVRRGEEEHLDALRPLCAAIHTAPMRRSRLADAQAYAGSLVSGLPFLVARDALAPMFDLVARLPEAERFDIVHADQLTMGQFALAAKSGKRVFDAHNAVWTIVERGRKTAALPARPLLALEARRLQAYEGRLCREVDAVLAVSEIDRQALVAAGAPAEKISVIPIAIDCAALAPVARHRSSVNILTVSTLLYPPNADGVRWFMREVFPQVRQHVPAAGLTIVGPRPPRDIRRQAEGSEGAITVTGYVPELLPYLQRAALIVVPVRAASGMRVRILEALAQGIPVVTTAMGVEGIEARHGEHLLVADEPKAFADAVADLLLHPERGQALARNGRRLVEERYDWQAALPALEDVYMRAMGAVGGTVGERIKAFAAGVGGRPQAVLAIVLALAVLVRAVVALGLGDEARPVSGAFDQYSYDALAQRVVEGHGFSFPTGWYPYTQPDEQTAHWSYAYTLYLAAVYTVTGHHPLAARLIQVLLSAVMCWQVYHIGRRLFGEWVGVAGAALAAAYTYFVFFAAALMTQTFYIVCVLAAIDAALQLVERPSRRSWLMLGLALGVGALLRQTLLLFAPLLIVFVFWRSGRPWPWRHALMALLLIALLVLPWTVYNYAVFDDFLLLNSNGGYWLYCSNHPGQGVSFDGNWTTPIPDSLLSLGEPAIDRALMRQGLRFIVDDPSRFLRLSVSRLEDYFWLVPSAQSSLMSNLGRMLSYPLYLPLMLAGVLASRRQWRSVLPLFLYAGFDTTLCLLTWAAPRYRLPSDAVMMVFAGLAVVTLATRLGIGERLTAPWAGDCPEPRS